MKKYVAAVQMECVSGNIKENTRHIIRLLKTMKKEEPGILFAVFPEMALYGYERLEEISMRYQQQEIMKCLEEIATVCKNLQLDAVVGAPYFGETGLENALYFLDTAGKVKHVYSKMHLIAAEISVFVPGKTYGICQTSVGRAGFLICWDSAFSEEANVYAKAGVELLVISAAWESPYERQWELAVCGNSFANDVPAAASNCIGESDGLRLAGRSMLTDCMGNILAEETKGRETYIIADLEQMLSKKKRQGFGSQIEELNNEGHFQKSIRSFALEKEGET